MPDQVHGGRADDPAIAEPDGAAGDDHLDRAVAVQLHGDVDVVGDHQQAGAAAEGMGHLLRRRADIDEEGTVVGDQAGSRGADQPFLGQGHHLARIIRQVVHARCDDGAAMDAHDQPCLAQFVEVPADGLRRHVEDGGELVHTHASALAQQGDDLGFPARQRARFHVHPGQPPAARTPRLKAMEIRRPVPR